MPMPAALLEAMKKKGAAPGKGKKPEKGGKGGKKETVTSTLKKKFGGAQY